MKTLFTIGHSTHAIDELARLLSMHGVTAVCDVRSHPYSRYNPQFNREPLKTELKKKKIAYVFLGDALGPRSDDPECMENGKVSYDLLARTETFQQGLTRLDNGLKSHRVALMCSEKDPLTCHRMILICRQLRNKDIDIRHILEDGSLETLADTEKRLVDAMKVQPELFDETPDAIYQRAYDKQAQKIAYRPKPADGEENGPDETY